MPAEIFQQILAALYGLVHVEARHAARRTRGQVLAAREHHGGAVVLLGEARCHDADNALVPLFVVDHHGAAVVEPRKVAHEFHCLLRHLPVEVLARLVVEVDALCLLHGLGEVVFHQQRHGLAAALHTPRGVDARADFEDDIVHRQLAVAQPAHLYNGAKPRAGVGVQAAQAVIGEYAVFARNGHDVGGDAHHAEVEQGHEPSLRDAVALGEGLHQLEAHAAAREVGVGIAVVGALGVEYGHGVG